MIRTSTNEFIHWSSRDITRFFYREFSIDSGVVTIQEVFENDSTEKWFNELQRVKKDLKSKDNEICENTDRKIQDLTASPGSAERRVNGRKRL